MSLSPETFTGNERDIDYNVPLEHTINDINRFYEERIVKLSTELSDIDLLERNEHNEAYSALVEEMDSLERRRAKHVAHITELYNNHSTEEPTDSGLQALSQTTARGSAESLLADTSSPRATPDTLQPPTYNEGDDDASSYTATL